MSGGGVPHQPWRLDVDCYKTEACPVYPSHLDLESLSAQAVNVALSKCLYNRGAYDGVLSSWPLDQCEELDKVFATEIRRRIPQEHEDHSTGKPVSTCKRGRTG